ncbi:MAG TPA: adenylate kinase family protein [Candidatus Nanoarchaeia archaeon]|nr:adenylate kinase family protein [Candidatus Nanoarchaeia archaeon]
MKTICVTGSVASGKTTIAKELSKKLKYKYIDVSELIKENKLQGKYIKKLDTHEVDAEKLNKFLERLIKESKENLIIDSHLSHYLDTKYIDLCIVCKCEIKDLKKRLEAREYSKDKIRENLDAEIFDVCLVEALENKHKIIVVNTSENNLNKNISKIISEIKKL